jgi:hypothetical protein
MRGVLAVEVGADLWGAESTSNMALVESAANSL